MKNILNRHAAIERFCVLFLVLAIAMMATTTSIVVKKKLYDNRISATQIMYTTTTSFSKTATKGNVERIATNADKTKVFVLLKWEDMSTLSASANDYVIYLTGSNGSKIDTTLLSRPSGHIYVFGTTGYMGVLLMNAEPFPSQILNMIIRDNRDLSGQNVGRASAASSFSTYNQCQVYFNPGADTDISIASLNADSLDMASLYKELISYDYEGTMKQTLNSDLETMHSAQLKILEYENRLSNGLDGAVLVLPEMPEAIAGDDIVAYSKATDEKLVWNDGANGWLDSKNNRIPSEEYYYKLDTDYVFPGGFDIDWFHSSILTNGWLDQLSIEGNVGKYLSDCEALYTNNATDWTNGTDIEWYYSDGSRFTVNSESTDTTVKLLSATCTNLIDSWREYYQAKLQYQTSDTMALLRLENEANVALSVFNASDGNVVTTY